jgi:hypothetical protein
MRYPNLTHTPI